MSYGPVLYSICLLFLLCPFLACLQDGGTALLAACQYGHTRVVETLLKHGANIHDQLCVSSLEVDINTTDSGTNKVWGVTVQLLQIVLAPVQEGICQRFSFYTFLM